MWILSEKTGWGVTTPVLSVSSECLGRICREDEGQVRRGRRVPGCTGWACCSEQQRMGWTSGHTWTSGSVLSTYLCIRT